MDLARSFNLNDPDFVRDPYPVLAQLRSHGKPLWHEEMQLWLAATHADASAVLRSKTLGRIYTPQEPNEMWETFNWLHADSIMENEGTKHTRLRALVSKAFNRGQIERLAPRIEKIVTELLDLCAEKKEFDLLADYAEPLPVRVIAELLGVSPADAVNLRPWSQAIVKMYEFDVTEAEERAAEKASAEFAEMITEMVEDRKKNPTEDLVSELAQVEEAGEKLTLRELIATCVLLLNAGHEASVNAFGNGFVAAMNDVKSKELLLNNPRAITSTAIEEFFRFDAPLQLFERTAMETTEINGIVMERGSKIAALLGSANRDEKVFERANYFDLQRNPNNHVSFGGGIHFCLGAPLARLELGISMPAFFEHFPNIEISQKPTRRDSFVLRGWSEIKLSHH
ncbi:MAG TPA: cytochrome P450 [Candidatus Nanopelagicaceae bacterium]|nr:cytochrome P450 [Candidatus Nanopelagicaceae bacterium]